MILKVKQQKQKDIIYLFLLSLHRADTQLCYIKLLLHY